MNASPVDAATAKTRGRSDKSGEHPGRADGAGAAHRVRAPGVLVRHGDLLLDEHALGELTFAVRARLAHLPQVAPPAPEDFIFTAAGPELGEALRLDVAIGDGLVVPLWADRQAVLRASRSSLRTLVNRISAHVERACEARERIASRLTAARQEVEDAVDEVGGGMRLLTFNVEPLRLGSSESMLKKGYLATVETLDDRLRPQVRTIGGNKTAALTAAVRNLRMTHRVRSDAKVRLTATGGVLMIDAVALAAAEAAGVAMPWLTGRLLEVDAIDVQPGAAPVSPGGIRFTVADGIIRASFDLSDGTRYSSGRLRLPSVPDANRRHQLRMRSVGEIVKSDLLDGVQIAGFVDDGDGTWATLKIPTRIISGSTLDVVRK